MQKENNQDQLYYYDLPFYRNNWEEIKTNIRKLQQKAYQSFEQFTDILHQCQKLSGYNPNYCYYHLQKEKLEYVQDIFSRVSGFVLKIEEKVLKENKKFTLFLQDKNQSQTYSKQQVIMLMCFTALCLNRLNTSKNNQKRLFHRCVNFSLIYSSTHINKVPFILNYFDYVLNQNNLKKQTNEKMTIIRRANKVDINTIIQNKTILSKVVVYSEGSIEDETKDLTMKIDFANKFIGGGALGEGSVQQQIMFLNHPELFITMLLCEVMNDNEAIGMHGFKKYFKNSGYGNTTQFDGFQVQSRYKDQNSGNKQYIVAIDALSRPKNQYLYNQIVRQISKSYTGFNLYNNVNQISTGNWGCGAFGGNPQLKFIIQWISASLSNKSIIYYPFKDKRMTNLEQIINILQNQQVGQIFKYLIQFQRQYEKTVLQYIREFKSLKSK